MLLQESESGKGRDSKLHNKGGLDASGSAVVFRPV